MDNNNIIKNEVDTVIIGGGITGITCAYLLSKIGKSVVLLEKEKIGQRATVATTAMLTRVIDTDPISLIRLFGLENAKKITLAHEDAISAIEKIINEENIDCKFSRCSNYIYAESKKEEKRLKRFCDAFALLGINAEFKNDQALKFSPFGYIEIKNDAKFIVMKYVRALVEIAKKNDALILEDTEVVKTNDFGDCSITTLKNGHEIKSKNIIEATYAPLDTKNIMNGRASMYRSYVVEYKVPSNTYPIGIYQDTLYPYNYFRVDTRQEYDRILIGGADHLDVIGLNEEVGHRVMQNYFKKYFGEYIIEEVRSWSGQILNSTDGLPYIGKIGNGNTFYAFAFSGNGMTYSYIAANIILNTQNGGPLLYNNLFDANRKAKWWANIFMWFRQTLL